MRKYSPEQALEVLKNTWGYTSFRKGQDKAIESILEGSDTFVLFPTGGGKSLCFQVPALLFDGLTLVISPLVALMQDQVQQLKEQGVSAAYINSTMNRNQIEQVLVNARNGMYKLVYCSPERLKTSLFQEYLGDLNIEFVAIDESHCISEWGHDFRPSYRLIKDSLKQAGDKIRWMALTATATPEVQEDILKNLKFKNPAVIRNSFGRENLIWWVSETGQRRKKLINTVEKASKLGSGLIYSNSRRDCEEIADLINRENITTTEAYHAGLESGTRADIQKKWIDNKTSLVVSTCAFGMGIDKSDCRYVIHNKHPYSLEAYYQEAGRAGRDGEMAFPVLLFKESDYREAQLRIEKQYPVLEDIQKVYNALCDDLSIALNELMDEFRLLDESRVGKRANLNTRRVNSVLNLLQKSGVIELIDSKEELIGLHFPLSLDSMNEKVMKYPEKSEFLDKLVRSAGTNAFEEMQYISLEVLLDRLQLSKNSLLKGLQVLQHNDALILFEHHEQQRKVKVLSERQRQVPIDSKETERHRSAIISKLNQVYNYIKTDQCREVFLRSYFGDTNARDCGKCDNCVKKNKKTGYINPMHVEHLRSLLQNANLSLDTIMKEMSLPREVCLTLIQHLTKEGKVSQVNEDVEEYKWLA